MKEPLSNNKKNGSKRWLCKRAAKALDVENEGKTEDFVLLLQWLSHDNNERKAPARGWMFLMRSRSKQNLFSLNEFSLNENVEIDEIENLKREIEK